MMKGGKVAATPVLLFLAFVVFVCSLVIALVWNLHPQFEDDSDGRMDSPKIKIFSDLAFRRELYCFRLVRLSPLVNVS
jgi:hypothetical protein